MSSPLRVFRRSDLWTQCEECKLSVDLSRAGACTLCRRILCNTHLHGSFMRRLLVDLGAPLVCIRCRRESVSA